MPSDFLDFRIKHPPEELLPRVGLPDQRCPLDQLWRVLIDIVLEHPSPFAHVSGRRYDPFGMLTLLQMILFMQSCPLLHLIRYKVPEVNKALARGKVQVRLSFPVRGVSLTRRSSSCQLSSSSAKTPSAWSTPAWQLTPKEYPLTHRTTGNADVGHHVGNERRKPWRWPMSEI